MLENTMLSSHRHAFEGYRPGLAAADIPDLLFILSDRRAKIDAKRYRTSAISSHDAKN